MLEELDQGSRQRFQRRRLNRPVNQRPRGGNRPGSSLVNRHNPHAPPALSQKLLGVVGQFGAFARRDFRADGMDPVDQGAALVFRAQLAGDQGLPALVGISGRLDLRLFSQWDQAQDLRE